jgi:hypothetical protein
VRKRGGRGKEVKKRRNRWKGEEKGKGGRRGGRRE